MYNEIIFLIMVEQRTAHYQYDLDVLRTLACFLVVWQHVTECYYILPDFNISNNSDTSIIGWINSLTPIEVPLFVMISGYFLLPMNTDIVQFFKRRIMRVIYPFIIWCIVYALYYVFKNGDSWQNFFVNILHIPVNFGTEVGHLWFIYMILGLYMLTPIISPWLEQSSKKQIQGYLCLWGLTNCLPYIHLLFPAVLGECFWNPSPMLYYFTGFAGYYVLGFYIRRFGAVSLRKSILLIIIGYLFTAFFYQYRLGVATNVSELELGWRFCAINISVMALGVFSLVKNINWKEKGVIPKFIADISSKSYAVYFIHLMIILLLQPVMNTSVLPVYIKIPLITMSCFLTSYLIISVLYLIPGLKKWIG